MRGLLSPGLVLVLVLLAGLVVPAAAQASPDATVPGDLQDDSSVGPVFDADEDEGGETEEEEEEGGGQLLPEWWGLGEEAAEAPYMGLVELGVTLLIVGVLGYSIGKRTSIVPVQYRRYLLQAHEWTVLVGTALVIPHFVFVEEWEGLGFLLGILIAIEVLSGIYGRHLHRHVIRLDRGEESPPLVGGIVTITKKTLFTRWRRIHVLLTFLTGIVLVLHIVTTVGD